MDGPLNLIQCRPIICSQSHIIGHLNVNELQMERNANNGQVSHMTVGGQRNGSLHEELANEITEKYHVYILNRHYESALHLLQSRQIDPLKKRKQPNNTSNRHHVKSWILDSRHKTSTRQPIKNSNRNPGDL